MKVKIEGQIKMEFDGKGELRMAKLEVDPKQLRDALPQFDVDEEVIVEIRSKK